MASQTTGGGGAVWEDVPRYITRTKKLRMARGDFIREFGLGRNRTAAGAAALAAAGLGRYRVRRRMRRGGTSRMYRRYRGKGLYTGTGGFWGDLWNKSAGLRGTLGNMARSSSNPYLQMAGQASQMLGTGAYGDGVVNNEIVNQGAGMDVPSFATGGGEMGTIQISHKEYVADVFGPDVAGTFSNVTYGINPALPQTFPWLSQVAANYEEYTIKQLIFTYRSTVTDFVASNGQVGTVLIATQYNANDAPFASKQDMMEYAGAVSAKVSQQIIAGVECDPAQLSGPPGKYTRSGPTPPGEDVKTYDLGTLNVATSNTPEQFNNQAVGELWVSYTIELRKPKFFVTRAQQLLTDVFIGDTGVPSGNPTVGAELSYIPYAFGQQNRIGGALVTQYGAAYPPIGHVLYYVFPATFSGDVEIELTGVIGSAGGNAQFQLADFGAPGGTTGPPGIVPIYDIWNSGGLAAPASGWAWGQIGSLGPTSTNFSSRWHAKIVSPTSAASLQDNILKITVPDGPSGPLQLRSFQFSITMYNTGMNDAKSKRLIAVNPSTQQVINFPQGAGTLP